MATGVGVSDPLCSSEETSIMLNNNDSVMDVSLEELLQEANLDDVISNGLDESEDDDIQNDFSNYDPNENMEVPPELSDYFNYLGSQTQHLEKELEECDELLLYMSHQSKDPTQEVVLYDDFKMLEQTATDHGMTLEEFKQKILNELEQEDFTEEDVKCEFEEFTQLQKELEEIRSAIVLDGNDDIKAILAPEENTDDDANDSRTSEVTLIAIDNVAAGCNDVVEYKPDERENKLIEAGSLVSYSGLSSMQDYVIDELRSIEKSHEIMSLNFIRSVETQREEEEKRALQKEEQRQRIKQLQDEEKAIMMERQMENERVVAEEQKARDEQITQELNVVQAEIEKISEAQEEEKHLYDVSHGLWVQKMEATRQQAATRIQKIYRGQRIRRLNKSTIQKLKDWKEARKNYKHMLRVMEVEYELKYKEEQAQKEKEIQEKMAAEERRKKEEEERLIENEQKKKEKNERIVEEWKKEQEKRKEEKKLKEEQRIKDEEELKKREEVMRKNEEKKKQMEEKLLKIEESDKRKEELKKKKIEEKMIKEEEEKKKKEEKKKIEDEEMRKKKEEKKIKEEKKREKEKQKRIKEEEEKKKEEEKKIKEEELRKKEKRIKEEVKRKKEEQKKIEDEEKKKKEEEKRIKEEEKMKNDEERAKEEEKRKTEEKKRTENEEMRKKEEEEGVNKEEIKENEEQRKIEVDEMKESEESKEVRVKEEKKNILVEESDKKDGEKKVKDNHFMLRENEIMTKDLNKISDIESNTTIFQGVKNTTHGEPNFRIPKPGCSDQQMMSSASGDVQLAHKPLQLTPCASTTEHAADISLASDSKSAILQELATSSPKLASSTFNSIDLQRLNWIQSCIPWSKTSCEPWKLKQSLQKSHKRPSQAKKLPPVSQSLVLDAALANSLREISSVKLTDLPDCSVSTLSQCWSLRYLTVTKCGVMCLDGLNECKHLLYINAENNNIEYLDLKDLGSLQVVRLAHNNLSVIHGLDSCINLRWLDLSHNRITRISGLNSLRRVHTVDLSNNQIVSSQGLNEAVTIQYLNLSHNYLQHFTDVSKLCLLTDLNLSCNNLLEVPELMNQVLLQTLYLQENSIKSLEPLDKCWLPLLCTLDCSQNMIESVTSLSSLIQLSHLDISLNQITDMENLLPGITQNKKLETLMLEGNPLVSVYDGEYRQILADVLPLLTSVDHQSVNPSTIKSSSVKSTAEIELQASHKFIQMCLSQINQHSDLRNEFETQMNVLLVNRHVTGETLCSSYFTFCDTSFKLASEHRLTHEYRDSYISDSVSNFTASVMNEKEKFNSVMENKKQKTITDKNKTLTMSLNCISQTKNTSEQIHNLDSLKDKVASEPSKQNKFNPALPDSGPSIESNSLNSDNQHSRFSSLAINQDSFKTSAYIKVNPLINKDLYYSQEAIISDNGLHNTNNNISYKNSDQYQLYLDGKNKFEKLLRASSNTVVPDNKNRMNEITQESITASQPESPDVQKLTGVKASVVGNHLYGLSSGERSEKLELYVHDVDESFDFESMGFDIDKYLDIEELDELLDKGWRPAEISENAFSVLEKNNSGTSSFTNIDMGQSKGHNSFQYQPPFEPSNAWMLSSSELKGKSPQSTHGYGTTSPQVAPSPFSVASVAETINAGSVKSKKEELSEEWGFKDSRTADMMLARAKKMKYNGERRRKLSELDPQQRYHLLKKIEEKYRVTRIRPPFAKVLPRKEYFKAREEELQHQEFDVRVEKNTRAHRLYEWLHTQVGDHVVSSSRINPGVNSGYTSNDNTKNVATGEIHSREISPLSDHQKSIYRDVQTIRRYSTGETQTGHTSFLPPIKQDYLPSNHKNERISFRDSPVVRSGGWGAGKRKEHRK